MRAACRLAAREADRSWQRATSSPWNDNGARSLGRARVESVVSVSEELLVELAWQNGPLGDQTCWIVGSAGFGTLVTLNRWQQARALVSVFTAPGGFLLLTAQARVNVRATSATGSAPTA